MTQLNTAGQRVIPYAGYKFRIKEVGGDYIFAVNKVGALSRTVEVMEYREGGDPSLTRKSPGQVKYEAITLERAHNPRSDRHAMLLPTVHSDYCTGCGKCEKSCVLPGEAAIKVLPVKLARGSVAEHYRRGWEEKNAAGRSLIGEQVEMPVRGLEDKAYGDTRVAPGGPSPVDSGWKP